MHRIKAFYSIDALLSSVIVVFMLFYAIKMISLASYDRYIVDYNIKMKKIFIASEYITKYSVKKENKRFPNEFYQLPSDEEVESLRKSLSLEKLSFSLSQGEGNCIVRYMTNEGEIVKVFICGE